MPLGGGQSLRPWTMDESNAITRGMLRIQRSVEPARTRAQLDSAAAWSSSGTAAAASLRFGNQTRQRNLTADCVLAGSLRNAYAHATHMYTHHREEESWHG